MPRKEKAMEYFQSGYNCSQAVLLSFADLTDIPVPTLARLASSFGGGMGRLREVCGAVSGMFMAAGILYGYDDANDIAAKAEHYKRIQYLAKKFQEKNGSIVCRTLLSQTQTDSNPTPAARTDEYYKKRPCKQLVGDAAEILEEYISQNPIK